MIGRPGPERVAVASLFCVIFGAVAADWSAAAEPRVWRLEGFTARKAGELENISLEWDGSIALAPRMEVVQKWPSAQVWALARDSRGVLYAGTGNDGLLIAIEPGKNPVTLLDAEEPVVQAVLVDRSGRVIAATSPGGKVYRVEGPGKAQTLFDPPETYIWALAQTAKGELLVATGDPAAVYRVGAGGQAEAILKSEERHFRCLAVGPAGDIYAGTAENAYLYRITPQGEAYVLYDAPGREISALAVDSKGTIYASAIGGPPGPTPEAPAAPAPAQEQEAPEADVTVTVTASAPGDEDAPTAGAAKGAQPKPKSGGARNTDIYRIHPDGYPEALWRSATEVVYGLAVDARGDLLAAAGEPAAVLRINARGKAGEWARLDGAQATHLLPAGEREWIVATSNLGSVVRLGPALATQGTYTSPVKDAEIFSSWGRLRRQAEVPSGSALEIEARSGNTQTPGDTWSGWRAVRVEAQDGVIASPPGRFLQWRAKLRSERGAGPVLRELESYYAQRNVAPELTSVRIEDPGVVIQSVPAPPTAQQAVVPNARRNSPAPAQRSRTTRRAFERGKQTISWTGRDRNQDSLRYELHYRRQEENVWKPLKLDLEEEFYAFDTTSLADGRYRVRVTATDAPANPPGQMMSGEAESDWFMVDNTSPRVQSLQAGVKGNRVELTFEVADSFSPVDSAELALDGGEWMALDPLDGVADSLREQYRAEVEVPESGEHTFGVRATDQMGNRGAGHLRVELP
jgi:hypothetical protein